MVNYMNTMKSLNIFVNEQKSFNSFRINQDNRPDQYTCQPKNKDELRKILKDRLKEDPNADLNDIDVSKIINISAVFTGLNPHNINISDWDMSNVENAGYMFYGCEHFNCDLSNWDMSKVKKIHCMFAYCKKFEGKGLEKWNVSKVEDMSDVFYRCDSLKNKPSWYKL